MTINGNGHTIYGLDSSLVDGRSAQNITICDLTISGTRCGQIGGRVINLGGSLVINNCIKDFYVLGSSNDKEALFH